MPYVNPKINWQRNDSITMDDMNRIENNTKYINTVANVAGGANALTLPLATLIDGYKISFIAKYNNNSQATTINDIPLYHPNSTRAPKIKAGNAYRVWYSQSDNCFYVNPIAIGNAQASQVLAGTTFSNEEDSEIPGSMPITRPTILNQINSLELLVGNFDDGRLSVNYRIPNKTYIQNVDWVRSYQPDLIPQSILSGQSIFGVSGNYTFKNYIHKHVRSATSKKFSYLAALDVIKSADFAYVDIPTGFQPKGYMLYQAWTKNDTRVGMTFWDSENPQYAWMPASTGAGWLWFRFFTDRGAYVCNSTRLVVPITWFSDYDVEVVIWG